MKHIHHIVPKHMGGTNDPSNLIELTPEEHADAHRNLYETYGHWQDYVAWKGLERLFSNDDCIRLAIIEGAKMGAKITNGKRWSNHIKKERQYPLGTDGRRVRTKRYWYNNGISEGQFDLDAAPENWTRGRLKGKYGGDRVSGANLGIDKR